MRLNLTGKNNEVPETIDQVEIQVLPHQIEFIQSYAPSTGLVAGFGSGKSIAGTIKCIERMKQFHVNVGYYLPTYQLIKDIAFENFAMLLTQMGVPYELHETDKVFRTPIGSIIMRSMDKPSNIIGYQTGYSLIDEADVLPTEKTSKAYKAIVARNRLPLPDGYANSTDMVSTPEGFKFLYQYYVKEKNPRRVLIQADTRDNPYLTDSYIENLYDTYPAAQLEAYMRGQFVNLTTGSVYRDFDRTKHVNNEKQAGNAILHVGMDFNITNMAATISVKEKNIRYVVDEIVNAYDTSEIAKIIRERYPKNRIMVYPDAAGAARSTSGSSDHDILRKAGFIVIAPKKNPPVRDRVNAVNNSFAKMQTFVNDEKCPALVEALENQAYNKQGEPDKTSGFDHVMDGFGYEVWGTTKTKIKVKSNHVF